MATNVAKDAVPVAARTGGVSGTVAENDNAKCVPQRVDSAREPVPEEAVEAWSRLYAKVGLANGTEQQKRAVRMGVLMYCTKNGTSPDGAYPGVFITGMGTRVHANYIPVCLGHRTVRQACRAVAAEFIDLEREQQFLVKDRHIREKALENQVPLDQLLAVADFLEGHEMLTMSEATHAARLKKCGLVKARSSREGKTTADVVDQRVNAARGVLPEQPQVLAPAGDGW